MKKIYQKCEAGFVAIVLAAFVAVWTLLFLVFNINHIVSFAVVWLFAAMLTWFVAYNRLKNKYGYYKTPIRKDYLFYIPMVLACTTQIWFGMSLKYSAMGQILAFLSLGIFGYVEEIVFRGFLFRLMEKKNLFFAISVSSILFGTNYWREYINGDFVSGLLAFLSLFAMGFAVTMIAFKSGSLIPGIVIHCIFNIASIFRSENYGGNNMLMWNIIATVFVVLTAGGFGMYLCINKLLANPYQIKDEINDKGIRYVKYSKKTKNAGKGTYQKRR